MDVSYLWFIVTSLLPQINLLSIFVCHISSFYISAVLVLILTELLVELEFYDLAAFLFEMNCLLWLFDTFKCINGIKTLKKEHVVEVLEVWVLSLWVCQTIEKIFFKVSKKRLELYFIHFQNS